VAIEANANQAVVGKAVLCSQHLFSLLKKYRHGCDGAGETKFRIWTSVLLTPMAPQNDPDRREFQVDRGDFADVLSGSPARCRRLDAGSLIPSATNGKR